MSCEVVGPDEVVRRVRELVPARLAGHRVTSIRSVGSGQDHAAVEVDGELVVTGVIDRSDAAIADPARDLAHGVRTGRREYAAKRRDALNRLFASATSPAG